MAGKTSNGQFTTAGRGYIMNDLFSILTGIITHAYLIVIGTGIMLIPAKLLFNAFYGKNPI